MRLLMMLMSFSLLLPTVTGDDDGKSDRQIPPRPKFNKAGHLGTVWSQANPWWPPNKSRTNGSGGPDFAWHKYPDDSVLMWKKVAETCAPYGMSGLQLEITQMEGKAGYSNVLENMLDGFKLAGNDFKAMVFLTPSNYKDKNNAELMKSVFRELHPILKKHPNAHRVDGIPVIAVYRPGVFTSEEWRAIINEVEGAFGRMIWLADANNASQAWLKNYMRVFDGVSIYANWSLESQRKFVDEVVPLMKKDFAEKIFEFGPHNTYCVHFHYGGMSPKLTEKFVKSWDMTLEAKPDSIVMTNFFDCYENSRILPSYEIEDILLKMSEYYISKWKKTPAPESANLPLYVGNLTNALIGSEALFEVIGFPWKSANKKIMTRLEVCDAKGEVLHSFPEEEMVLDSMRIQKHSLPTLPFANQRALFPRLKMSTNGKDWRTISHFPPTMLATSMRPHLLMWCRSVGNMIGMSEGSFDWSLAETKAGGVASYAEGGTTVVNSNYGPLPGQHGGHVRVLRNGREIDTFGQWDLKFNRILRLPDPGDSLDWYNLELENGKGRHLSPAIWVSKNTRPGKCVIPVLLPDDKTAEVEVEAARVPFFHYPCDQDNGNLLVDRSGYDHHGFLGGEGYGGGHLQRTAYRHEHLDGAGPTLPKGAPKFEKGEDGKGFLRFANGSCVMIMGGTAFPHAHTYELSARPDELGKKQGLIGAPNGQTNIELTPDGRVRAWRSSSVEGEGGSKPKTKRSAEVFSKEKLETGKWHRIATTYDMKKLSLYVDGVLQGQADSPPDRSQEWINPVSIGSLCAFPWKPVDGFTDGIRDVRIYGRNLAEEEFLKP